MGVIIGQQRLTPEIAQNLAIFGSTWPPTVFTTCVISDELVYMKHKF